MPRNIAIVEDEESIAQNYCDALRRQGYKVSHYRSRPEAGEALAVRLPDLAIIDIGLGEEIEGGFALCRDLRARSPELPIIFLTARDSEFDVVSGLRLGADDYMTKDISQVHMLARLTALFRRVDSLQNPATAEKELVRGQLKVNLDRMTVLWDEKRVDLTVKVTTTRRGSYDWTPPELERTYNNFGQIESETNYIDNVDRTVSFTYDKHGNLESLTYPDNYRVEYGYDQGDRFADMSYPSASNWSAKAITVTRDVFGQADKITRGNGTVKHFDYDRLGRLIHSFDDLTYSNRDISFSYTYNPANQITSLTYGNTVYRPAASNAAIIDSFGVNSLNQYTVVGGVAYDYDGNGNLTFDGEAVYGYDLKNRLVSVVGNDDIDLEYDAIGRLRIYSVNGEKTYFAYAGDAMIAEYDASGNMKKRYVHGPGIDQPLMQYYGSSLNYPDFLHTNHQGSIVANSSSYYYGRGSAKSINRYDEFGVPEETNTGRFGYTGQMYLPELGMYHYKARVYDPKIGRFLQTDPIESN